MTVLLEVGFQSTRTKEGDKWVYTSVGGSRGEADDPSQAYQAVTRAEEERVMTLVKSEGLHAVTTQPERFGFTSVKQVPAGQPSVHRDTFPVLLRDADGNEKLVEATTTHTLEGPGHRTS
ncbi:hypothetical protein IID24_04870 [Patescibacteria group bacterium]|nr:hypothetical protein [Patescibacteria group bacterium]